MCYIKKKGTFAGALLPSLYTTRSELNDPACSHQYQSPSFSPFTKTGYNHKLAIYVDTDNSAWHQQNK